MYWNGETLRQARQNAGMTLEALASSSGVAASTLSQLENGGHEPRLGTIRRLAEVLSVDPDFFVKKKEA